MIELLASTAYKSHLIRNWSRVTFIGKKYFFYFLERLNGEICIPITNKLQVTPKKEIKSRDIATVTWDYNVVGGNRAPLSAWSFWIWTAYDLLLTTVGELRRDRFLRKQDGEENMRGIFHRIPNAAV